MRDFNDQARPLPVTALDHQTELLKLITSMAGRHGAWQVFADFVEMGAISISNAVDLAQREIQHKGRCVAYFERCSNR